MDKNLHQNAKAPMIALIHNQALKGRPDVMHGCNPCAKTQQANHGHTPCTTKTLLLLLLLVLMTMPRGFAQTYPKFHEYAGTVGSISTLDANVFPDDSLRATMIFPDSDQNGSLSFEEVRAYSQKQNGHVCSGRNIVSVQGIEIFEELPYLDCSNNSITQLDLTYNTYLTRVDCYGNQMNENSIAALINSLPVVEGGTLVIVDSQNPDEGNYCLSTQVALAAQRGWTVYDYYGGGELTAYEGADVIAFGGGSGTEATPFLIATTDDMDALAASVNGGNDYEGVYFRQTDNLDYEGKTYTPVGTPTHPFRGIFDGRSYTISHVTLGNNNDNQGLFGYVENATLSYIRLANSQISAKDCVGGIVGHGSGTIESCYVEDDVVVLGHEDVGGIIGNFSSGNILFCENSATVAAESNYLGGIAGNVDANPYESATISYCFNYGTIGFYNFGKYGNFLGGIVGRFSGYNGNPGINNDYRLEGCINHGSVYGYNYRGGIAGFTDRISVIDNLSLGYVINGDYGPGAIVGCSNGGSMDYYSNNYYAGNASYYLSNAIGSLSGDEPNEAMRGWIVSEGEGIFVQLMPDEDYNITGLTYDGITYLGAGQTGYFIIGRLDGSAGNFTVSAGTLTPVSSEEYENYYALTMPTEGQDVTISSLDIALTVPGYDTNPDAGWKLIASPVVGSIEAETVGNIFLWEYDLFRFSPSEALEWRNYKNEPFELVNGQGYLYASEIDITLLFGGTYNEAATHDVPLEYDPTDSRKCWNLVGNPFPCEAYLDRAYYVLGENGTGINPNAIQGTVPIPPCTAVFVKAVEEGDSVVFTRVAP